MIYPYETCVSLAFLPYKTPRKQGKRKAKFHFLLYHAKVLLFLLKYHWFLCKLHNKKDPDLQKSRPKRQTSARSRSLSYTVWFDSILLLCLDTQCTISSCIATGFFPVKRLPEADRILQKIIPCIHRIAISQDTGFAPKQDIWLCPVTKFVMGQTSSSFKGQKFSSSALFYQSINIFT